MKNATSPRGTPRLTTTLVCLATVTTIFEKMTRYDATTSEQGVIVNGDDIATITVERADANASRLGVTSAYPKWQAVAYAVDFCVEGFEDCTFHVEDFGSARAAHTAAKNYVREAVGAAG